MEITFPVWLSSSPNLTLAYPELRGYDWRGADCDDWKSDVYPGRRSVSYGPEVDHNCNGIFGVNNVTGRPWEDELCSGTQQMGTLVLGDSASAHFRIPPQWLTAADINSTTYSHLFKILTNELDWPHMSAATGFTVSDWPGKPEGPMKSIYLKMRENNLCNHRGNCCLNSQNSR